MERALFCPNCRLRQPSSHRYCLRCGHDLPSDLLSADIPRIAKTNRFFAAVKVSEGDPDNAYLRVSCYKKDQTFEAPEGTVTIPGHHVRFSVWSWDKAMCVVSLPESEARALAEYLVTELNGFSTAVTPELS